MWSVLQIHVAAWGLFEKKDVETANRVASARTMDGFKIRAKLVLSFPRPVGSAEAESVMMQYARAFASIVECELSNGDLPFEESELHQRITDSVQALPKKNVRLIGLHVLHKGAVSSRSMPAVKPGPDGKATVPAMAAVSAPPGRTSTPSQAAHTATTIKPEARGAGPLSAPGVMSQPPSVRGAVTVPAPATASPRSATTPAMRAPMPGAGGAGSPATRAMTVSGMPATGARPSPAGNADTGKKLFVSVGCYQCHGYEAQGGSAGPRLAPRPLPYAGFSRYVRRPTNQMPPYTERLVPDTDLAHIYAYLQSRPTPPAAATIPLLQ